MMLMCQYSQYTCLAGHLACLTYTHLQQRQHMCTFGFALLCLPYACLMADRAYTLMLPGGVHSLCQCTCIARLIEVTCSASAVWIRTDRNWSCTACMSAQNMLKLVCICAE